MIRWEPLELLKQMYGTSGIRIWTISSLLVCSTFAAGDIEELRQLTQDRRFFEAGARVVCRKPLDAIGVHCLAVLWPPDGT